MSENGIKLGQLLCDADVITKRQLSKALQEQVKGKKGTLGEILVDMGVCTFEDITDAMMNHSSDTQKHEEKHEEIHREPIPQPVQQPTPQPVVEEPKVEEPIELSEEKVMGTKFTMSLQTLGALISVIAAGVGGGALVEAHQVDVGGDQGFARTGILDVAGDRHPFLGPQCGCQNQEENQPS